MRDYNKVYDILIEAGADDLDRNTFVHDHTIEYNNKLCREWRFCGKLGFGGKYWRRDNVVSCYSENLTPEREKLIKEINAKLALLPE